MCRFFTTSKQPLRATFKEVSTHALLFCVYQMFRPEPLGTGFQRSRTLVEHAAEQVWTNKDVACLESAH